MQKSKLIQSLKFLTKEELKRFRHYMQTPFFKKSANSQALFEWIYTQGDYPNYESPQLDSEVVTQHLFPNKKNKALREKSLSVVASELVGLMRKFLVQLEGEKEENRNNYLLLRNLQSRRMDKDFWQVYRKTAPQLEKFPKTIDIYYEQYLVEELVCNFRPTDKSLQREKKKTKVEVHDVLHTFEVYTILNKLQYCCFNWNRANILTQAKNKELANELIDAIEKQELNRIALIHFYYLNLLLLVTPNIETHFYELKELLKNKANRIEKNVLGSFYIMATNYCNRKVKEGVTYFHNEVFDLYLLMLEQKLMHKGKYVRKEFIKNLVTVGLQAGKKKWSQQFIEDIQKNTIPEYRDSVYAFNKGLWYFYQQDYGHALQMLLKVENIDVFYNLDCRGLLLKCYYELQETDALFSLSDAFRKFVQQQKIAPVQKKAYLNFSSQTVKLYKVKLHPNKSLDAATKQKLLELEPINNQKWLLEKAEEL